MRLLDRGRSADEGEVGAQAVLGRIDGDTQRVERLEDFDPDRADLVGVGTIGRCATRDVHADLAGGRSTAVGHHAERSVDDVAVRVQAHRRCEEQAGVLGVAVEEVAVVMVDVARGGLRDRT